MAAIASSGLLIAAPALASPQREAERTAVRAERAAGREAARAAREAARRERQAQRAEHKAHTQAGSAGCHVTIEAASNVLPAGEPALLKGLVSCPAPADAAGLPVTIYGREAGTTGFTALGNATTEADGSYELTTAALQANSSFYASIQGKRSGRRVIRVAPEVSIVGPPEGTQLTAAGIHRGATASTSAAVIFTGTVTPQDEGSKVVLQREHIGSGDEWRRIGLGQVGPDGTYSISHSFAQPGNVNIRVIVRSPGHTLPGISEPLSYEISQRQNPLLTIQSSSDPISYGQSTTISGTLAAGDHQQVTLIGRTRGGSYTTIATTTTDETGAYSFPPQSPTANMDYKVTSGHVRSSTLSQGVRPVLSAQMSSVAVASARQLTFTGTVTPDRTGQLILLERQRPSGVGADVVASATIAAGSTYTIPYTLFGSAAQRFRIKLPGGAESLVAAGPLFKVPASEAG